MLRVIDRLDREQSICRCRIEFSHMETKISVASLACSLMVLGADFSGKYKGAVESSTSARMEVTATIRQQGEQVTGTIGPRPAQMTPLEDGKVENGKLTFRVVPSGGLRFSFPEAGETLSGTITSLDGKTPQFDRVSLRRVGELTLADTVALLPNEGAFPLAADP
jgi:hypothetical protein